MVNDNNESTTAEYRCPECGTYCKTGVFDSRAYCISHGWFRYAEATHVVGDADMGKSNE
jgi:hypothetical protein